jgi:hypothetical protein
MTEFILPVWIAALTVILFCCHPLIHGIALDQLLKAVLSSRELSIGKFQLSKRCMSL